MKWAAPYSSYLIRMVENNLNNPIPEESSSLENEKSSLYSAVA
jgi:hypothetical protein